MASHAGPHRLVATVARADVDERPPHRTRARDRAGDRVPPANAEGALLFAKDLTFAELTRRFKAGAELVELRPDGVSARQQAGDGLTPLFLITDDGGLRVVTVGTRLEPGAGDKDICLAEPGSSSP